MGADAASVGALGRLVGNQIRLAGSADTMPGAGFLLLLSISNLRSDDYLKSRDGRSSTKCIK